MLSYPFQNSSRKFLWCVPLKFWPKAIKIMVKMKSALNGLWILTRSCILSVIKWCLVWNCLPTLVLPKSVWVLTQCFFWHYNEFWQYIFIFVPSAQPFPLQIVLRRSFASPLKFFLIALSRVLPAVSRNSSFTFSSNVWKWFIFYRAGMAHINLWSVDNEPNSDIFVSSNALESFVQLASVIVGRISRQPDNRLVSFAQVAGTFRFDRRFERVAGDVFVLLDDGAQLDQRPPRKNQGERRFVRAPSVFSGAVEFLFTPI